MNYMERSTFKRYFPVPSLQTKVKN